MQPGQLGVGKGLTSLPGQSSSLREQLGREHKLQTNQELGGRVDAANRLSPSVPRHILKNATLECSVNCHLGTFDATIGRSGTAWSVPHTQVSAPHPKDGNRSVAQTESG